MLARSNKGIALIAMTLSVGGLVLMRAPKNAGGGEPSGFVGTGISNKASTFFGPGLRGELTLSHGNVLARPGFELYADLKLTADKSSQAVRAPLAIAIVLDNSGSMQGEKLDEAKRSIARFIGDMQDNDEVSFVKYSDSCWSGYDRCKPKAVPIFPRVCAQDGIPSPKHRKDASSAWCSLATALIAPVPKQNASPVMPRSAVWSRRRSASVSTSTRCT
jgi:von Willebrand factor type A domain